MGNCEPVASTGVLGYRSTASVTLRTAGLRPTRRADGNDAPISNVHHPAAAPSRRRQKVRRMDRRASLGIVFGVAVSLGSTTEAAAGPSDSTSAVGTVTVRALRTAPKCSALRTAVGQSATFPAVLEWRDDGATVSSSTGSFSCALHGTTELSASEPCNIVVGGGLARVAVSCPAENVSGRRDGDVLRVTAGMCHGVILGCEASVDATVLVAPRRGG